MSRICAVSPRFLHCSEHETASSGVNAILRSVLLRGVDMFYPVLRANTRWSAEPHVVCAATRHAAARGGAARRVTADWIADGAAAELSAAE